MEAPVNWDPQRPRIRRRKRERRPGALTGGSSTSRSSRIAPGTAVTMARALSSPTSSAALLSPPDSSGAPAREGMGVGGQDMHQPLGEELLDIPDPAAERPFQARAGELGQHPPVHQLPQGRRALPQLGVALRVGQHRHQPGQLDPEQLARRHLQRHAQGQLHQQVAAPPQGGQLGRARGSPPAMLPRLPPRRWPAPGQCPGGPARLAGRPPTPLSPPARADFHPAVGCCHHRGNAVRHGGLRHGHGPLHVGGAVIDAGKDVAVEVDHRSRGLPGAGMVSRWPERM